MLFNSYVFIAAFLPLAYLGHLWLTARSAALAAWYLAAASLVFYGWWNPANLPVLALSIIANYVAAGWIHRMHAPGTRRMALIASIAANLAALGYYKYAGFAVANLNAVTGLTWQLEAIVLPLGISFFTFTQIAYLVDVHQSRAHERNFRSYLLFVTFFPHLIAGPIVHHADTMPQFSRPRSDAARDLALGLTMFVLGLFKKVVLADGFAEHAKSLFDAGAAAPSPTAVAAWTGVAAYAFQLYFDFSGYSDMAIGLARMFGIDFPVNFNSPYKAVSIIDFWRRWHMTLSRFLRDYLYVPLGGNRLGRGRRYANLMATMLLGGLWHGANWTFVAWGALHGAYLAVNHAWRQWCERRGLSAWRAAPAYRFAALCLTFAATLVAWVYFRAHDMTQANGIVRAMLGAHGLTSQTPLSVLAAAGRLYAEHGVGAVDMAPWLEIRRALALLIGAMIVWGLPNTQQFMRAAWPTLWDEPGAGTRISWRASPGWAVPVAAMAAAALMLLNRPAEFLYFQF